MLRNEYGLAVDEKELGITTWEIAYETIKSDVFELCDGLEMFEKEVEHILDASLCMAQNWSPKNLDQIIFAYRGSIFIMKQEFNKTPAGKNIQSRIRLTKTINDFFSLDTKFSKDERDTIIKIVMNNFENDIKIANNTINAEANFLYNLYYEYKTLTDKKFK